MKANKTNMLSLALSRLKPDSPAPFPLYIFLEKNNRMVPVRLQGDALGEEQYQELLLKHHDELWVPKIHEKEVAAFLEYLEKMESLPEKKPEEDYSPNIHKEISSEEFPESLEDLAKLVEKNLQEGEIDLQESRDALAKIARAMLKELKNTTATGLEARRKVASQAKVFSDEFLKKCIPANNLYESILLLRSIQDPTEHSVYVGSLASLLSSAIDKSDPIDIANLLAASTFHDIGLKDLAASILQKPETLWSANERAQYETHVEKGVNLLASSEDKIPSDIIRMVEEHHERIDGKGFPKKLSEGDLLRNSKLLLLANEFSILCEGRHSDSAMSPADAFLQLANEAPAGGKLQEQLESLFQEN